MVVAGLGGQGLVVFSAIWLVPGITSTFWSAFLASWIVAGVGTGAAWIGDPGTDDAFAAALLRRGGADEPLVDPDIDGVVFVQIDGVPFPVLRWAVQGGAVPTMRRWLASGSYELHEWVRRSPAPRPPPSSGLLHGTVAGIPAFRWYEPPGGGWSCPTGPRTPPLIEGRVDGRTRTAR